VVATSVTDVITVIAVIRPEFGGRRRRIGHGSDHRRPIRAGATQRDRFHRAVIGTLGRGGRNAHSLVTVATGLASAVGAADLATAAGHRGGPRSRAGVGAVRMGADDRRGGRCLCAARAAVAASVVAQSIAVALARR
jgi:hypothetical protein